MGLRVFLTGISGYLGGVLARRFASMPEVDGITGIYNAHLPTSLRSPKVDLVRMDIRSPDLARAMTGHQVVVHTAFIVLWPAGMPARVRDQINLGGTRNVAEAAVENGALRFLHASSIAAYDPAQVWGRDDAGEDFPIGKGLSALYYANSKALAESILTEVLGRSGVTLTLFRPCYIAGPNDRTTIKGIRDNAARFTGLDPRLQWVHEDDVAEAFARGVLSDMPGAYNLAPDDFVRESELLRLIGASSAPTVPIWLARLVTQLRWRFLGSPTHGSWVDAARADFTVSNAKLKATGWAPRYDSAAAIRASR